MTYPDILQTFRILWTDWQTQTDWIIKQNVQYTIYMSTVSIQLHQYAISLDIQMIENPIGVWKKMLAFKKESSKRFQIASDFHTHQNIPVRNFVSAIQMVPDMNEAGSCLLKSRQDYVYLKLLYSHLRMVEQTTAKVILKKQTEDQ